jgi:hypothetical protein
MSNSSSLLEALPHVKPCVKIKIGKNENPRFYE